MFRVGDVVVPFKEGNKGPDDLTPFEITSITKSCAWMEKGEHCEGRDPEGDLCPGKINGECRGYGGKGGKVYLRKIKPDELIDYQIANQIAIEVARLKGGN